jgi:hypothetical protein
LKFTVRPGAFINSRPRETRGVSRGKPGTLANGAARAVSPKRRKDSESCVRHGRQRGANARDGVTT